MLSINTNITSMLAMNALNKNTGVMNTALNRLSTGYRINSSKDDAAGSAISASLSKEISSFDVAQDNAQMGQSMIDTANSTLDNIRGMVQRIRNLAVESANGTYGDEERKAMQNEVESLVDEIYRIKETTEFNGKKLFGTEAVEHITEEKAIAKGYTVVKTAEQLKEALKANDVNCKVMLFADINLDDLELDETGSNWTVVGTGSKTFKGVLDGNGFSISNLKMNRPDENCQSLIGYASNAEIKNLSLENVDVKGNQYAAALVGRNDNSLISNCNSSGNVEGLHFYAAGLVGMNYGDNAKIENCSSSVDVIGTQEVGGLVGNNVGGGTISNSTSCGSVKGSTKVGGLCGMNQNGAKTENCSTVSTVVGTSEFWVGAFVGSHNGILLGNEYNSTINEGMRAIGNVASPTEDQITDNTDLVITPKSAQGASKKASTMEVKLQVGIDNDSKSTISVDTGLDVGLFSVNIETEYGATKAIDRIDALMNKIVTKQTELGAVSNRLQSTMEYQQVQKDTKMAVLSVIKDADIAKESSEYIKAQILQQTTASLLSQANQTPSIALRLLAI